MLPTSGSTFGNTGMPYFYNPMADLPELEDDKRKIQGDDHEGSGVEAMSEDSSVAGSPSLKATFRSPNRLAPKGGKVEATPEKNKAAKRMLGDITAEDVESHLLRRDHEVLSSVTDTPVKKARSDKATRTYQTLMIAGAPEIAEMPFEERENSPHFHKILSSRLMRSPWLGSMLRRVEQIHQECLHPVSGFSPLPERIYDLSHITAPVQGDKKKIGFHFCPPTSEAYQSLKDVVINSSTKVFSAKFDDGSGGLKISTFFPTWIKDEEMLLQVLLKGQEIARCNNRSLFFVEGDKTFVFEAYDRERAGRQILVSAFPVFSFSELGTDGETSLGGLINVPSKILVEQAAKMLGQLIADGFDDAGSPSTGGAAAEQPCKIDDATSPIRFVLNGPDVRPDRFVFEFAPLYESVTHVSKGVLVAIPIALFESSLGHSAITKAMTAKLSIPEEAQKLAITSPVKMDKRLSGKRLDFSDDDDS